MHKELEREYFDTIHRNQQIGNSKFDTFISEQFIKANQLRNGINAKQFVSSKKRNKIKSPNYKENKFNHGA